LVDIDIDLILISLASKGSFLSTTISLLETEPSKIDCSYSNSILINCEELDLISSIVSSKIYSSIVFEEEQETKSNRLLNIIKNNLVFIGLNLLDSIKKGEV
jgi:hypothetical protein